MSTLRYATPVRFLLTLLGATVTGVLGVAVYTGRRLNGPRKLERADSFAFSPWEVQVPHEDVQFVTEDGITIRAWWFPRPESLQVAVCCAGHRGGKHDLLGIGSGLWRAGMNVLLFDYRGCGESD